MNVIFENRFATAPLDVKHYDTEKLRQNFLIDNLMQADQLVLCYTHYERLIVGSAVPVKAPVALQTVDALKAEFFLQRRAITGHIYVEFNRLLPSTFADAEIKLFR